MNDVDAFIDSAERCSSIAELGRLHIRAMADDGYPNVVFCRVYADGGMDLPWSIVPAGYLEVYRAHDFHKYDPVLARLVTSRSAVRWSDVIESAEISTAQRAVMENCRSMGAANGLSFPFHGPGGECDIFSVSAPARETVDPAREPYLKAKTFYAWSRYLHLRDCRGGAPSSPEAKGTRGKRAFYWRTADDQSAHSGGPEGMSAGRCRALVLIEAAMRRRKAKLFDLDANLSSFCGDSDLEYLLAQGLVEEVREGNSPRRYFAPSVLGHAHLRTCPAVAQCRRAIWTLSMTYGERPRL